MLRQRNPREHDDKHLAFIRTCSCLVCGDNTATEAAHVRFGDPTVGKRRSGISERPDDCWTVPLCGRCHRGQHDYPGGEREWWKHFVGIEPLRIALALFRVSGDYERGEEIVQLNRPQMAA